MATTNDLSDDLLFAARSDDFDEVKACINKGANINYAESYGKSTPLHYGMFLFSCARFDVILTHDVISIRKWTRSNRQVLD